MILLIEREKGKIKKAQLMILLIEREKGKIKKAQLMIYINLFYCIIKGVYIFIKFKKCI